MKDRNLTLFVLMLLCLICWLNYFSYKKGEFLYQEKIANEEIIKSLYYTIDEMQEVECQCKSIQ